MKIDDKYIIDNYIVSEKISKKLSANYKKNIDIYEYLINRYADSESLPETIYRIYHNIDTRPICKYCGHHVNFKGFKFGFFNYCSNSCAHLSYDIQEKTKNTCNIKYGVNYALQSNIIKEKAKKTSMKKYGVNHPRQSIIVKEKYKKTNIEKYGVEYPSQNINIKEKTKQTCIEKYGFPNPIGNKDIQNKSKQTCIEKYGVEYVLKSKDVQNKSKQTCIEKYGVDNPMKNKDIINKTYISKKIHKTFNTSKIEQQFKEYLEQNFPNDFEYQYRSELYPFNCDFYIKSLDLYIEIQGYWTHGIHPFNKNNKEDIEKLNFWYQKKTKRYQQAIHVWSFLDPLKRQIAEKNNLNYLEIFSSNIDTCIKQFSQYKESIQSQKTLKI